MGTTSPQDMAAAYQACINEALRQCPPLIQRRCDQLVKALHERSLASGESAEKRKLQDAIASLRKNQATIENCFALELTSAMDSDIGASGAKKTVRGGRSISQRGFDDLELTGDNQVQETVDSARLLQIVSMACEAGPVGLSARLSTAQGFGIVKTDKNPLRPEIVSNTLLKVLLDLPANNNARSCWLVHGAQIMGRELQSLYVMLDNQLARSSISPAAFVVIQPPNEANANSTVSVEAAQSGRADGSVEKPGIDALLTLDHLHRLLIGDYDESFKVGLLPSGFDADDNHGFSHSVPDAMDVLADLQS